MSTNLPYYALPEQKYEINFTFDGEIVDYECIMNDVAVTNAKYYRSDNSVIEHTRYYVSNKSEVEDISDMSVFPIFDYFDYIKNLMNNYETDDVNEFAYYSYNNDGTYHVYEFIFNDEFINSQRKYYPEGYNFNTYRLTYYVKDGMIRKLEEVETYKDDYYNNYKTTKITELLSYKK